MAAPPEAGQSHRFYSERHTRRGHRNKETHRWRDIQTEANIKGYTHGRDRHTEGTYIQEGAYTSWDIPMEGHIPVGKHAAVAPTV